MWRAVAAGTERCRWCVSLATAQTPAAVIFRVWGGASFGRAYGALGAAAEPCLRRVHPQDIKKVRVEASALVKYMVGMKSTGEFNAAASRKLYDAIKAMVDFQKTVGEVRARLCID